jgi:hypothetical protein
MVEILPATANCAVNAEFDMLYNKVLYTVGNRESVKAALLWTLSGPLW